MGPRIIEAGRRYQLYPDDQKMAVSCHRGRNTCPNGPVNPDKIVPRNISLIKSSCGY